jgi:hypothetical protein
MTKNAFMFGHTEEVNSQRTFHHKTWKLKLVNNDRNRFIRIGCFDFNPCSLSPLQGKVQHEQVRGYDDI